MVSQIAPKAKRRAKKLAFSLILMVIRAGLEPATQWLKACATIQSTNYLSASETCIHARFSYFSFKNQLVDYLSILFQSQSLGAYQGAILFNCSWYTDKLKLSAR